MATKNEIDALWDSIVRRVERIVACLDGLTEEDLNWRPMGNANSLFVLATHTVGNVEANILGVLCGQAVDRHRDVEFRARGADSVALQRKWRDLKEHISLCLAKLTTADLERQFEHGRRGQVTGREALSLVARHAAEHQGHAELTRDLLLAARGRPLPPRDEFGTPIGKEQ